LAQEEPLVFRRCASDSSAAGEGSSRIRLMLGCRVSELVTFAHLVIYDGQSRQMLRVVGR
jgi:hypothetical protein